MQSTDIPLKLPIPFGQSAGTDYRRLIPVASQIGTTDGAASLTDGFPPLTSVPRASGGKPPAIKDVNGILFEVSAWSRWVAAGGPVFFDSTFVTQIGGYPFMAFLASATSPGTFWVNLAEGNTTNPDSGGSNWQNVTAVPASNAETLAGANTAKFVTPAGLASLRAASADVVAAADGGKLVTPLSLQGLRATQADFNVGSEAGKFISPAVLSLLRASVADTIAGTSDRLFLTPASLAGFITGNLAVPGHFDIGPLRVNMGQNRQITNAVATVFTQSYDAPFSGAALAIGMFRFDNSGNSYSQKHYVKAGNGDANGFLYKMQDDDSGDPGSYGHGFDFIALGLKPS